MFRRLLPTLVALGCGLLALTWGLVSLQRIFAQEREDAHAQVRSRREALEQLASQALRTALTRKLEENIPALYAAVGDPLAPGEGFYLLFRGYQFLPRITRPRSGTLTPARDTYESLARQLAEDTPEAAWLERLARLRGAEAVLASGPTSRATARKVEELLRYHAEHPLPAEQELPFTLLMVERLQRGPATHPLVRSLLREGLPEDYGGMPRAAGLQRDLLRERGRFTQADFDFLLERIIRLSAQLGEPSDDLQSRVLEAGAGALVMPEPMLTPMLIGEQWYLEPGDELVRGISVDLDAMLRDVARELRRRDLIGADARVHLRPGDAVRPQSDLGVEVAMPEWAAAERAIDARYGLKTLLVMVCGVLAVAIVAISVVAQQRKYRFLQLKSDFVATVSHELRTPLASIRLLGETLERRLGHTPEAGDYPTRIVRAADGLHFLVENILSFNRIDKGRWTPKPSWVRLEELVAFLRDDLAGAVTVPVNLTAEVGDLELELDASLLRMLFANLGRNACAYNRRSPVELDVRAYLQPGHGCTVLFSDNGVGIPQPEWENVFQDFYRLTPPGQEVHGSGLGLALCRKIMALHRGTLHIAASGPEGTTFVLTFPEPRR